jgi:hypothetical protein
MNRLKYIGHNRAVISWSDENINDSPTKIQSQEKGRRIDDHKA